MTSYVECNEIYLKKCYSLYIERRDIDMPSYILCDDLIDQMVEELSYIKLKTSIELEKKNRQGS